MDVVRNAAGQQPTKAEQAASPPSRRAGVQYKAGSVAALRREGPCTVAPPRAVSAVAVVRQLCAVPAMQHALDLPSTSTVPVGNSKAQPDK